MVIGGILPGFGINYCPECQRRIGWQGGGDMDGQAVLLNRVCNYDFFTSGLDGTADT